MRQLLQIPCVSCTLREAASGAFDVADVAQSFAAFREHERFGDQGGDEILALLQQGNVARGMKDPLTQQARAHRRVGAIHHAEQGMLTARTRFDEVEIALRRGIDEHGIERLAHAQRAHVSAVAPELMDEIMQGCPRSTDGG